MEKGAVQAVVDGYIRLEMYHKVDRAIREINTFLDRGSKFILEGELENIWCYGPPRTGKSRWARETYPGAYLKSNDKWWGFYA